MGEGIQNVFRGSLASHWPGMGKEKKVREYQPIWYHSGREQPDSLSSSLSSFVFSGEKKKKKKKVKDIIYNDHSSDFILHFWFPKLF